MWKLELHIWVVYELLIALIDTTCDYRREGPPLREMSRKKVKQKTQFPGGALEIVTRISYFFRTRVPLQATRDQTAHDTPMI